MLKRLAAILCLLIILFQSTSRCWILAAFYMNRQYIAENICVNRFDLIPVCRGICFLDEQMTKEAQKEEQLPDLKQKEISLFCTTLADWEPMILTTTSENYPPAHNSGSTATAYLPDVFHPPVGA
ncbi:hypothetical protein KTO58_20245 [Chitinophaga pendula]|uniref:hypothetical protein n=1 Tax=Chitinophaga TaxID=79328 RepID=UPI000BB016D5|nr:MULTISPECIES: hypothetical protein [Chitinophaga]ASZ11013.1 hypothetical protein CK934_08570 [Chitinophaga sp. MD30]UCJ05996.1 hypothetical protein KTO58_20245 [Chitinophaga pendula]